MPIPHLYQMIEVGSEAGNPAYRLYVQLKRDGIESTPDGTPTVIIYDPAGVQLTTGNLTNLSDAWYYIDFDSTTWDKAQNYRAEYTWTDTDNSLVYHRSIYFAVVRSAWNDPEITSEEFENEYASFVGEMPSGWTDWTPVIFRAHRELIRRLRDLQVDGKDVLPSLILNREDFAEMELRFAAKYAAKEIVTDMEEREIYNNDAEAAWKTSSAAFQYEDPDNDDGVVEEGTKEVIPSHMRWVR